MTIRLQTDTGLAMAYKPCLRRPRTPEMTFIVRGRYRLAAGAPLALLTSEEIPPALIEKTRADDAEAADDLARASLTLGQGSLTGDRYLASDEDQRGELLYASDFADYKLRCDVLLRGTCHPPRSADSECEVSFGVGAWKKSLKIVGHRLWVDRAGGGKHTDPKPIGAIAVDYAHAYGGIDFANNPVGKGHPLEGKDAGDGAGDDVFQPPRSERSAVMPAQQLPNVLWADGRAHKDGLPAGFGPLSPSWPFRAQKLGTKYDQEWLETRAPYFSSDMDGSYFNAAPPDQQLEALRGDEELAFVHLHPTQARFTARLPGQRVRVFVRDAAAECREIAMRLDTLFADLDEGVLTLTWRGVTPVKEEDLSDVEFGLVVSEPLEERPTPASVYVERLEAFAADPIGLKGAFPDGLMEFAKRAEALEDATDAELEALVTNAQGNSPPVAAFKNLMGSLAPEGLDTIDASLAKARASEGVDPAAFDAKLKEQTKKAFKPGPPAEGEDAPPQGVGMRIPVREGEKVVFPIGNLVRDQEKQLLEAKKRLPKEAGPEAAARIDAALAELRENPKLLATDPHYKPYSESDPPPQEPGPGADLLGRDLSDLDLSGKDLSGADLQCAILSRTKLVGANLAGAKLGGARFYRADLSGADLSGADLTSASFDRVLAKGAKLDGARLDLFRASQCELEGASLRESEGQLPTFVTSGLERADLGGAKLLLASFDHCRMAQARFGGAKLEHVRFDECEAQGLVLEGAELLATSFKDSRLQGAEASKVRGDGAIFHRSNLQRANFRQADLAAAHFLSVDALQADFGRAHLPKARFDRAVLREADFERANLIDADLRKAVLTKVNFSRACLHGAQLTEAFGVDLELEGANTKGLNTQRSKLVSARGKSL